MTDRTVEQVYADQIARQIDGVAARLRSMAEDTERAAAQIRKLPDEPITRHPGQTAGYTGFTGIIATVQHDILWGMANLKLGSLTRDAADADQARTKERSENAGAA